MWGCRRDSNPQNLRIESPASLPFLHGSMAALPMTSSWYLKHTRLYWV